MARRKQSFESQLIAYFDSTPLNTAQVVFDIVKGRIKARLEQENPPVPRRSKTRQPVKVKVDAGKTETIIV